MTPQVKKAVQYVHNTGGNVDIAVFDVDHEPIGHLLRRAMMPRYVVQRGDGKLELTGEGRRLIGIPATPPHSKARGEEAPE